MFKSDDDKRKEKALESDKGACGACGGSGTFGVGGRGSATSNPCSRCDGTGQAR